MSTKEKSKAKPQIKPKRKILRLLLLVVVVLILLTVFLVPVFVSSQKGREIILAKINNSLGGRTNFATLSMGWFKGIKVTDISFNDETSMTAIKVKQIATKPHYGSILTGSLSFGKTTIDEPRVEINLKNQPKKEAQKGLAGKESQPVILPIKKIDMVVSDGSLKVTGRTGEIAELSRINSRLNLRPLGQPTSFNMDMAVVDKGKESKLHTDGQLTPEKQTGWGLKGTSGDLTVEVNDLDIESLGPIFALAGVEIQAKGRLLADVKSEIKDGRFESLNGIIKGKNLDVAVEQLKGDRFKSSNLDVAIKLARDGELINIENLQAQADWLRIQASGDVPTTFDSLSEFIKADSKYNLKGSFECDVAQLASQMPRSLGLKEGTKVTSGSLTGNIEKVADAGQRKIIGQVNLSGLEGTVEGKKVALSEPVRIEAEITSDKAAIKYDKLDVSSSFAKVSCTGSSELLKYSANVNLAKLQSELGQFVNIGQYQMAGELLSEGTISSRKEVISAAGSSVIKNLRLSSKEGLSAVEPQANLAFAFDVDRKSNVVNVASANCNASFGQISTKNAVVPTGKEAAQSLNLPIAAKVDLAKIQPFLVFFGISRLKSMQLAGIAESQISLSSEKDTYRIVTDSTKIKNFKLISTGQKPFEQEEISFTCDAKVNPVDKTFAAKCQLASPQIKVKGNFAQTAKDNKARLDGQADLDYNWAAVSTVASPFLPGGLSLKGQRKDTVSFISEYPVSQPEQLLANLSTKVKLGFEEANYMGLKFASTETEIKIQNGFLTIAPFSTTFNNGQLNFACQADFKQKPTLLKTTKPMQILKDIQINDETAKQLLMYVNPIFANAVGVSGVANFNCEQLAIPLAEGNKNDLETVGTIAIDNLKLRPLGLLGQIFSLIGMQEAGVPMRLHPTKFNLQKGFLRYDDMQLDIGSNPVNFKGVIGLDKSLNMTVTLPFTLMGKTVKVGKETTASRITLPLKGTVDKPELDTSKLLEAQLKGTLEEQFGEKAFEILDELLKKKK